MMETVKAKFCSSCGTKLPSDAAFCPNCGAKIEPSKADEPAAPREASAMLDVQGMPPPSADAENTIESVVKNCDESKVTALGGKQKTRSSLVRIIALVVLFGLLPLCVRVIFVHLMGDSVSSEVREPAVEIAEMTGVGEAREMRALAMARVIEYGIATYYAQHGEWPAKIESYAGSGKSSSGNPGNPGALSNNDADAVVQQVVKEADNGNPLLEPSILFVATKRVADGIKPGYGMNLGDARRRGVPLADMAFGYQRKRDGVFRRFIIKYDPTNNIVTVSHPDLLK